MVQQRLLWISSWFQQQPEVLSQSCAKCIGIPTANFGIFSIFSHCSSSGFPPFAYLPSSGSCTMACWSPAQLDALQGWSYLRYSCWWRDAFQISWCFAELYHNVGCSRGVLRKAVADQNMRDWSGLPEWKKDEAKHHQSARLYSCSMIDFWASVCVCACNWAKVRLLVLGSPIVMIVSGSVYTTFHCMTAGCVFLAVGITLLMVLFFGFLNVPYGKPANTPEIRRILHVASSCTMSRQRQKQSREHVCLL